MARRFRRSTPATALACALGALVACASGQTGEPSRRDADDYLRYCAYPVDLNEHVLVHWNEREMPLRVYLPPPPEGMFPDPQAIFDSVRDGVLDWSDVVSPGVPSFVFVESHGEADIPVTWAEKPSGDWYVAFALLPSSALRHFAVERLLVTARWREGQLADLHDLYAVVLHEMGHALGLGHSPDPADTMYPEPSPGLSERDRRTLRLLYARPSGTRIRGARSVD